MARRRGGIARVVIFLAVLAALLGGGIYAAGVLMSPKFIVSRLQQAVKAQTGRTLVIGGHPVIRFWPRIAVSLPDVRLSNPPQMARDDFVKVQRLDLELELWPLLQRELVLRKLRLKRPEIHLLVDGKGRANWAFAGPASSRMVPARAGEKGGEGGGGLIRSIRLAPVVVEKGVVLFDDARSHARYLLHDVDLVAKLSSPNSPLDLSGGATFRAQRVKFSLFVKHPARLAGAGSPIEAYLKVAGASVQYSGLAGFGHGPELAGHVEAHGKSLRALLHWLGTGVPANGRALAAFSLSAALAAKSDAYALTKLKMRLDGSNAQGEVRLDLSGPTTAIHAALGVDRVVTDTYLGPPAGGAAGAGGGKRVGEGGAWSQAPVVPDLPRDVRADIRISVNDLRHRQLKMGPGTARVSLKNGRFHARLVKMGFYGGSLSGTLDVATGGKKPPLAAVFKFAGVKARPFLTDLAGFRYLSGTLSGDVDVKSLGRSQLEIVGNLGGLANLDFRDGKVHGVDLVKLMELVQKGIVSGWRFSEEASTDFVELKARFVIIDGIAGVRELGLKGPLLRVQGKGEVDLLRQRLDLSFDGALVKRKNGRTKSLLKMPVPLLVKGPWQAPKIYPDIAGILQNPAAAFEKLQGLMRAIGAKTPQKALRKITGKETREKLKQKLAGKARRKLEKQLGRALGEERGAKAAQKAAKQMRKLIEGFFGRREERGSPGSAPAAQGGQP